MFSARAIACTALILAPIAPLAAQPATQVVPATQIVNVWNFGFGPAPIHLHSGRPVTLAFVNRSGSSHDFTEPAFFAAARAANGAPLPSEIDLAPHQTRTVTLVPARGTYEAHCSHFLHRQMGMHDVIVVD